METEREAKDLVHHFNRLGMAGVDLSAALAEARADGQRTYPPLREALPAFLDEQVALRNDPRGDPRAVSRVPRPLYRVRVTLASPPGSAILPGT